MYLIVIDFWEGLMVDVDFWIMFVFIWVLVFVIGWSGGGFLFYKVLIMCIVYFVGSYLNDFWRYICIVLVKLMFIKILNENRFFYWL